MAGPGRSALRSISGCSGGRQPANGRDRAEGGVECVPPPGLPEGNRVDGREFVWAHFKLNAEQRLRGFNFFVVLAIFADGGVLAALQQGFSPGLLVLLGAFTVLLAQVFWLVDARSRQLLELTIVALKEMEADYPESYRLFAADALGQSRVISYTFAIRALLLAQMGFGLGVVGYGLWQW
ncbi:conserved hypothetical protein [Stutzerimonas stutzeri A1501]|uniref:Uncharacterized protein n=1 Tax=Stutzerimonas stutzeri (strain A1501) TaxID=379731 RepID=A4VS12_STUS1|nr:conserved hypothetical protein [Stutzerimonas stutzeri A1501]